MSTINELHDGWSVLIGQAKIIAMLPLEEWLRSMEHAELWGLVPDTTLYRDYIYDPERRGDYLKDLIRAAIPLKAQILKLQKRYQEIEMREGVNR